VEQVKTDFQPSRREWILAAFYALVIVYLNAYICRDLVRNPTAFMGSMHGFWIALAKRAGSSWFQPTWWPYWDGGIPFEFTYAPLVPALTAAWAALSGVSHLIAFQSITAVVYCLGPLTLFVMAWLLTRAPGASFLAAVLYSLTAPTQLLLPDEHFSFTKFWDARRLYILTEWDDTPHALALALMPLAVVFLVLSLEKRQWRFYIPTVVTIALMAASSEFGPIEMVMAALCLLFVLPRADLRRNLGLTVALGSAAYAIASPFLPPSMLSSISQASANGESGFSLGSLTALALVAVGWVLLWSWLKRSTKDWRLQFFVLLAYLVTSAPAIAALWHRQFLPQPGRYKFEMELGLALVIVFGLRPWFQRFSKPLQVTTILFLLALAGEQVASHRRYAKGILQPRDESQTVEYRAATWAEGNLRGVRVMMPGSMAQWANDFSDVFQFSGSSWSKAFNPIQQRGLAAVVSGGETPESDARVSLAWLKAFGVGAVAVSGGNSGEYWKPYRHPEKFEGLLAALWRSDGVTLYQVPQRTASLAHVVPISTRIVQAPRTPDDIALIEQYVSALEDPSLPPADLQWEGRNRMRIRANLASGQALSVQVTDHPGWHASSGGRPVPIQSDGLGLMWLEPQCQGPCDVQFVYDGGWELRLCHYLSFLAIAGLVAIPLARWKVKPRNRVSST
jgi:hypothetical protein